MQREQAERRPWSFEVGPEDSALRLDRWLAERLAPEYSRTLLGTLIKRGQVQVNDAREKPSYQVQPGDHIVADLDAPPSAEPLAQEDVEFGVLYEDPHMLAVSKPAGLLTHPVGASRGGTLVNGLLHRYPDIAGVGQGDRPGIVHRLDRHTSGVLLVARTDVARRGLMTQFKERTVKKEYRAVVVGKVPLHSDYIDLPLGKDPRHPERMRVDLEDGKPSSTFYEVLERVAGFTVVRAFPLTGRTHQIRVHLTQLGHPVVLDGVYGKSRGRTSWDRAVARWSKAGLVLPGIQRHALHALRIHVRHPVDGRDLSFEAPLPPDMEELIGFLRSAPE